MRSTGIGCLLYRRRLAAFEAGALIGRDADRVAAHLAGCPHCQREWESLSSLSALLHYSAPAAAAPSANLWSGLEAQIRQEMAQQTTPRYATRPRVPIWAPAALAAGAAAVAAIAIVPYASRQNPGQPKSVVASVNSDSVRMGIRDVAVGVPSPAPSSALPARKASPAPQVARQEASPNVGSTRSRRHSHSAVIANGHDPFERTISHRQKDRPAPLPPAIGARLQTARSSGPAPEVIVVRPPRHAVEPEPASLAGAAVADGALRETVVVAELAASGAPESLMDRANSAADVPPVQAIHFAGLQRAGMFR